MLQSLHIENYALIEKLDLTLEGGLTVITGETGAGKSILLGALSLILGQRADNKVIQTGKDKCITEANFGITAYELEHFFTENDLEYDPDTCIVRRELFSNGKSRAFVNDSPVSLAVLKELSSQLMDIHSQHQNLMLGSDLFQLNVVDSLANNKCLLHEYQASYIEMKRIQSDLKKQEETFQKANEEEDYLRFQCDQLEEANLRENEQEELEAEALVLSHSEDIKQGLNRIFDLLDEDEKGIVPSLKAALNHAESVNKVFPKIVESVDRIRSSYLDMKDLAREMEILFNDVEVNPARMSQVNERLNQLFTLQQKHKVQSNEELLTIRQELTNKLSALNSSDENIQELKVNLLAAQNTCTTLAEKLTDVRKAVLADLEKKLTHLLVKLGMPKAKLQIDIHPVELNANGRDEVCFLFSANTNSQLYPIDKIASGGELSRIMLCIKSIIAESTFLPTLLFDEIDTGISGEIAYKMGEIMKQIAERRQVICITHLPQIAVKGLHHYKVQKAESNGNTITTVNHLTVEERLTEVALMLSGANLSEAALHNAKQLLLENHITI
jgi:DNA repair protein RecN (Recombination protein N)